MILPSRKLDDVKRVLNILSDISKDGNPHIRPISLFQASHILAWWINTQGLGDNYRRIDDINLIKPFWTLCQQFGFCFTEKERHDLFEFYRHNT